MSSKGGKPAPSRSRAPQVSSRSGLLAVIGAAVLLVVVGIYAFAVMTSGNSAKPGTTVGGVDISGMSQEDAAAAVASAIQPTLDKRVKVRALDQVFVVKPARINAAVDGPASVAPAYGRIWNPVGLIAGLFGSQELPVEVSYDQAALTGEVQAMADVVDVAPVEPDVTVGSGEPVVASGEPGRQLDVEATSALIADAMLKPRQPVQALVRKVEPSITSETVATATQLAQAATAAPVTVQADMVTATIPRQAIGRALSFTTENGALVPKLDGAVLHQAIEGQLTAVEVPGRDATFKIRHGVPKVVPSKVGRGVSDDELAAAVAGVLDKPAAEREVSVTVGLREPKLTTEQAQQLGVTEKLSSFTQQFPYAAYRVQNIGEAARRVNGTLLMPGETFSMNDTIKERTKENGYTVGFVVGEGGVFDEQMGGGVSTATTTVWTGAFYAGLERVDTRAHSIYISRYKPGLEATVAWGLFDMKFRNDTPNAVFITTAMTNTSMSVAFWGTKQYDKVEAEYGPRENITKYATIYDKSKDCLGQAGVEGFSITVDRVFYKDGKVDHREPITTAYKPAPEVICHKKPDKGKDGKGDANAKGDPSASASPGASSSPSSSASASGSGGKGSKPAKPSPSPQASADDTTFAPSPSPSPSKGSGSKGNGSRGN